ncbi:MAG: hypothetical protein LBI45_05370 [Bacteroidales bacterium]|jgi:hypothetical protein|nr:hypothetical protein [Bacteroidales bacterium]
MTKKGYNRLNYLKQCKIIVDIVNLHYKPGYTTYAGVFRTFIEPLYPMHYNTFMRIINMPNVDRQIEREMEHIKRAFQR